MKSQRLLLDRFGALSYIAACALLQEAILVHKDPELVPVGCEQLVSRTVALADVTGNLSSNYVVGKTYGDVLQRLFDARDVNVRAAAAHWLGTLGTAGREVVDALA